MNNKWSKLISKAFLRNLFFIFCGKQKKNIVWDCLGNQKGSFFFEIKKSYLLQVLVVVISCKGIKGKGGGRRLNYGDFNFLSLFFWLGRWAGEEKRGGKAIFKNIVWGLKWLGGGRGFFFQLWKRGQMQQTHSNILI